MAVRLETHDEDVTSRHVNMDKKKLNCFQHFVESISCRLNTLLKDNADKPVN